MPCDHKTCPVNAAERWITRHARQSVRLFFRPFGFTSSRPSARPLICTAVSAFNSWSAHPSFCSLVAALDNDLGFDFAVVGIVVDDVDANGRVVAVTVVIVVDVVVLDIVNIGRHHRRCCYRSTLQGTSFGNARMRSLKYYQE